MYSNPLRTIINSTIAMNTNIATPTVSPRNLNISIMMLSNMVSIVR